MNIGKFLFCFSHGDLQAMEIDVYQVKENGYATQPFLRVQPLKKEHCRTTLTTPQLNQYQSFVLGDLLLHLKIERFLERNFHLLLIDI